jgi:hypothetical protein
MKPSIWVSLVVTAVLSAGCGHGSDSTDSGPSPAPEASAPVTVAEQFEAVTGDVLKQQGLVGPPGLPKARAKSLRLGFVKEARRWVAHAFPSKGVKATQHLLDVKVPKKPRSHLTVALYELDVPSSVSACEAPWTAEPSANQPCVVEGLSDTARMVTEDYSGDFRDMYVIEKRWALGVTSYGRLKDRTVVGKAPLTAEEQRSLLLGIAAGLDPDLEDLDGKGTTWGYTAPGSSVSLTLPASWDAEDGAFEDGSVHLQDTAAAVERQLFLEPRGKESKSNLGGLPCRVLTTTRFDAPDDPGEQRVIQAVTMDTRAAVGKATFLMFVADADPNGIPCGATRGVSYDKGTVVLTNSLQFDTPEQAADWVNGDDYKAVVEAMKTLRVAP